jgi:hypothetical protein
VKITRTWAMPSAETFSIKPIAELLDRWLDGCTVVVDPFARNSKRGTLTNDLNPDTTAQHHMLAEEFVATLSPGAADVVLFDPPYSPRQIAEVYQKAGRHCFTHDTQNARLCRVVKDGLTAALRPGGVSISFGWNSGGFGNCRGFEKQEILLVNHGAAHNDTIVTVETKGGGL